MSLFEWKNPKAKWIVGAFVIVFVLLFVRECRAVDFQLAVGLAHGDDIAPWSDSYDWRAGAYQASVLTEDHHWELAVGMIDEQYADQMENYWYAAVERQVHWHALFLGLGLGLRTSPKHVTYLLPQDWNFSLSGGVDYGGFRLTYRHFSNGGLKESNKGQNWILAGVRF